MSASAFGRRGGWILVATLVTVAATLGLGFWQLDRAAQKLELQARIDARRALVPLAGDALARAPDVARAQHYRPALLRGEWLPQFTVFLDNRQMNGLPGFFVVTPFRLEGRAEAVAVQRGWVARDFRDRTRLPALPTPAGPTVVEGLIAPPPSRLFEFSAAASGPIRQNLDLDAYARELRTTLLPLSLLQRDSASTGADGLRRQWPLVAVGVEKHHGYAFQWFALSALTAGLYVWFQLVRPARRRP